MDNYTEEIITELELFTKEIFEAYPDVDDVYRVIIRAYLCGFGRALETGDQQE